MHIAFLTPEYPHKSVTKSAGLGNSIQNLAVELLKQNHIVTIFVYSQNTSEVISDKGIAIHKIAFKKYWILGWYFYRKYIQKYINKQVNKQDINLIEAPDWTGITAFIKFNCPHIIRLHGTDAYFCYLENRKQKLKNYFFEKIALNNLSKIVSVSNYTAKLTKQIFSLEKNITTIYNGIDTQLFYPKQNAAVKPNLLIYFGTIIRKKGVLELASIFNELIKINDKAELWLIGKDVKDIFEQRSTITLFKKRLSKEASRKVFYKDEVPYNKIKNLLIKAQVIVLPSLAEAFPMTWLEAMALEKPLVSSNIGWAKELMIEDKTGFMENPKNHKEYAYKINVLLNNTELCKKMGRNARKRIELYFSKEIIGKQNINFYKTVLKCV